MKDMKTLIPTCMVLAAFSFAAVPDSARAEDKAIDKGRRLAEKFLDATSEKDRDRDRARDRDRDNDRDRPRDRDRDRDRDGYYSRPANTFVLTLGNGYAGRGYYYGPPNAGYYYERSGVRFYRDRDAVPRQYWRSEWRETPVSENYSRTEASVQRALAQRGYYRGPIDGDMGPGSRAAVARYQADNGMKPTGAINDGLLRSLGL